MTSFTILPLSSRDQIPWRFQTFQVNIYGVSTQNEMYVISHCSTHIYSLNNYDNMFFTL